MTTEHLNTPASAIFGNTPMTFGEVLWAFRKGEGLTLAQAAEKLGVSKQLLSVYEKGKQLPSVTKVVEMALAFEQSPTLWVAARTMDELMRHGFTASITLGLAEAS
jgi:transcriptional regulator with XRE-family HTH domain